MGVCGKAGLSGWLCHSGPKAGRWQWPLGRQDSMVGALPPARPYVDPPRRPARPAVSAVPGSQSSTTAAVQALQAGLRSRDCAAGITHKPRFVIMTSRVALAQPQPPHPPPHQIPHASRSNPRSRSTPWPLLPRPHPEASADCASCPCVQINAWEHLGALGPSWMFQNRIFTLYLTVQFIFSASCAARRDSHGTA